jgi:Flp pilus assembly pilin Flp
MSERLLQKYIEILNAFEAEEGQTAVEYTLVLALVVAMAVAALSFTGLGSAITGAINDVVAKLNSAI